MKTVIRTSTFFLAIFVAGAAMAQVSNGDFEDGSTGWILSTPPNWTIGVQGGGNPGGHAHIQSPWGDSAGIGCFDQEFPCGQEDPTGQSHCIITFDYYLHNLDASPGSGRVIVMVDDVVEFMTDPDADWIDWTTVAISVPCGYHFLSLCLEVDPVNNGWEAGFDNVSATCDDGTATDASDWSTVKSLY